jgi:hypothetical protein
VRRYSRLSYPDAALASIPSNGGLMANKNLLYLTQVESLGSEPGRADQSSGIALLRSYLILQAMFFDRLMVGDSQLINIPHLRALLWPGEPDGNPRAPSDLAPLLDHGVLVPAIRSSAASLSDVREDLVRRGVHYAGDERYVNFIESHLDAKYHVTYQASSVSSFFREQVLATLSSGNTHLRLKDSVRRSAYHYVADQDVLYHIRMRQWMGAEAAAGRMSAFHLKKLENVLAAAYRHNIPKAVKGSLIDVPLDPDKFWTPIDIQLGRRSIIPGAAPQDFAEFPMRPFAVSPYVLSTVPVDTLLAIRADPSRGKALKRLEQFRRTGRVEGDKLAGELEDFLIIAEQIIYADARGELREYIRNRRRTRRGANLTVARDLGLAVAGMSIWGTAGKVAGLIGDTAGYAGLVVSAWASIQTLRDFGSSYRHGYAVGRAVPDEQRLLLGHPDHSPAAEDHS